MQKSIEYVVLYLGNVSKKSNKKKWFMVGASVFFFFFASILMPTTASDSYTAKVVRQQVSLFQTESMSLACVLILGNADWCCSDAAFGQIRCTG